MSSANKYAKKWRTKSKEHIAEYNKKYYQRKKNIQENQQFGGSEISKDSVFINKSEAKLLDTYTHSADTHSSFTMNNDLKDQNTLIKNESISTISYVPDIPSISVPHLPVSPVPSLPIPVSRIQAPTYHFYSKKLLKYKKLNNV